MSAKKKTAKTSASKAKSGKGPKKTEVAEDGQTAQPEQAQATEPATGDAVLENAAPAKTGRKATKPKEAKPKKVSAIDAAANVLIETGEAMNSQAMIKAMSDRGLWSSPKGLTPHATLYSAILREINTKGIDSRFRKAERGKFTANGSKT